MYKQKGGASKENSEKAICNFHSPSPIAAQQRTVTMLKVTFRLVIEWAGRGFRSQHLDIKYSKRQKREMMRAAAGIDPKIPRLCRGFARQKLFRSIFHHLSLTHLEINFICGPERIICSVKCDVQVGQRMEDFRKKRNTILVFQHIIVAQCHSSLTLWQFAGALCYTRKLEC